ncbi:Imidazolonepropionase [Lachnellula occidentalis]|uniref:Imidazolonepropionase n=1 Tax=Lachnellula occidentalis TaxID=215460 RepID=A0A8H8UFN8_9HELO|nr:Imidazolonepropionase [Lachnellula occidentalis]
MEPTTFILSDVRIFTGTDTIDFGHVAVKNGLISTVSAGPPSANTGVPIISKPGHTVVPGFIDAHIHADKGQELALYQSLKFGVTTVMDMHNETVNVHKLKKLAAAKRDEAADLKAAGLAATIDGGWPMAVVTAHDKSEETAAEIAAWPKLTSPADAEAYVAHNLSPAGGADYTKLMHESGAAMGQTLLKPSLDIQKAVITATHAAGHVAVAHCLARADTLEMLLLGINGLAHTFMDEPVSQDIVDGYKKAGAWCSPTLAVLGSLTKEGAALAERFANDERVKSKLTEKGHATLCRCMAFSREGATVENAYGTVRRLKAEGVPILVGSDAAGPGLGTAWGVSFHQELYLLVKECGFSPKEALHAGTALTAKLFGWKDRGQIAQGHKADLVLLEANPLDDIDATLNIRGVWRDGILAKDFEK